MERSATPSDSLPQGKSLIHEGKRHVLENYKLKEIKELEKEKGEKQTKQSIIQHLQIAQACVRKVNLAVKGIERRVRKSRRERRGGRQKEVRTTKTVLLLGSDGMYTCEKQEKVAILNGVDVAVL